MLKKITKQYLLGIGLALLTTLIVEGTLVVIPEIGWSFLTIIYVTIFVLQITFYYLTTNFNFGWTILSFVLNFVLWTLEQVIIEMNLRDSFIYKGDNREIGVLMLAAILWVTNKILIDKLFELNKSIHRHTSKINV